ncbi:MAG: phytoene dehydrogenase [Alphaproteobacteria bacterium]|nr:phytoene dehydrogenase [Alphaproteobacteria bacterium]
MDRVALRGVLTPPTVHIVGAGLAGLAAAIGLSDAVRAGSLRLRIYEATGHAGGRCRSYPDARLGRVIDNGNHLILGANRPVFQFLEAIGAGGRLAPAAADGIPFVDLCDGSQWRVKPGGGRLPTWLWRPADRVAGTRPADYLAAAWRLARAPCGATVAEVLQGETPLHRRLLRPLSVAILNTEPAAASARQFARSLLAIFAAPGGWRPFIAARGLSHALIEPAVMRLDEAGLCLETHRRLHGLERDPAGRVARLLFAGEAVEPGPRDRLILALPPDAVAELLPGVPVPAGSRAILNGHFLLPWRVPSPSVLGVIGGLTEWVFLREDVASLTVSAADGGIGRAAADLAVELWSELRRALALWRGCALPPAPPLWRIVKERRATFLQSPANQARRPGTAAAGPGILLAGDWTATGLPATLDGAIRSGRRAAHAALAELGRAAA